MGISIALYSHDSVGLGHARRNRALAWALAESLPRLTGEPTTGLLIAGHPDASQDSLPAGWDWLVLPGYTRVPDGYAARHLNMPLTDLAGLRSDIITAALDSLAPDLFIADRHAFGVDSELKPALTQLRQNHGTATVLGLRDVLDTPAVVQAEWERLGGAAEVAAHYSAVWVYGDQNLYDPLTSGEIPPALAELSAFTGLLATGRPADDGTDVDQPFIVTCVGGGSDGVDVLLAAAAAQVPAGHRHLIVTGPQMSSGDVDRVQAVAAANPCAALVRSASGRQRAGIEVRRSVTNLPLLFRHAAAAICMGGYNSTAEVLATDTPALVVPRASRRAEQPLRAAALATAGAVETHAMGTLTAAHVSAWLADAVTRRVDRSHLDLDGLRRVGDLALALVDARRAAARPATTTPAAPSAPAPALEARA